MNKPFNQFSFDIHVILSGNRITKEIVATEKTFETDLSGWIFSFRTMPRLAERICNFCGSVRRGANSNKLSVAAARRRVSGNRERTNNSKLRGKPERGILCVCLTFANLLKNLAVVSKRPSVRNISKLELRTSSRFRLFLRFSN